MSHLIVLDTIKQLDIDEETIKDNIDAYAVNHNLKEFDDKHMENLISELKVSFSKERSDRSEQLPSSNRLSRKIFQAPGREYARSCHSNKKAAHIKPRRNGRLLFGKHDFCKRQSLYSLQEFARVDLLDMANDRVWATPSKNDAFLSRKDSNVVKVSFDEVDSSLCDVTARQASSISIEIDPTVGEQDPKYPTVLALSTERRTWTSTSPKKCFVSPSSQLESR